MVEKPTAPAFSREEILFFGLDHLECYGTFLHEYLFEGMDFENSNVREFGEYVVTKHEVRKYAYKMVFTRQNHPIFAYYKGKKGSVSTKDYLCAYSSAFRLIGREGVFRFLYSHLEPTKLRRFDLALDLARPVETLWPHFPTPKQKWSVLHGARGNPETYYIGELKDTENKFKLVRIYDKIADTLKKSKGATFAEYLELPFVTRVEIEIRPELAKNARIDKLESDDYLLGIFVTYITPHAGTFGFLSEEKIGLFSKPKTVDPELLQSTAYRQHRTKLFLCYAKELYLRSICPVELLLHEGIVLERTKKALWYEGYATHFGETAKLRRENAKKLAQSMKHAGRK